MIVQRIIARNTATASPNKIHDQTVARTYGFAGGLVPGVTIFAWMCGPPADAFGYPWLERGRIEARFVRPVYDADEVLVEATQGEDGSLALAVLKGREICATGRATVEATVVRPEIPPRGPIPATLPIASADSLVPGSALGTLDVAFEQDRAREYLAAIGADHPLPADAGVAHPGWLLLLANLALSSNVALGPWIHVSSDVRLLGTLPGGTRVAAPARVATEYERKGHRFVELYVVLVAEGDRPVAAVRHTAIYEPRRPGR